MTIEIKGTINNIVNIESLKDKENNIILRDKEGYIESHYYFNKIYEDKEINKFIKHVEKTIRTSKYYESYIGILVGEYGLNRCAVLGNLTKENSDLEMHHYPFTLYDIVYLHVIKHIIDGTKFNSFIIADEVMKEHYENIIGIVPVSKLVHDLAHLGKIFISFEQTAGNFQEFVNRYINYMPEDMLSKYNELVENSQKNQAYSSEDILATIQELNQI